MKLVLDTNIWLDWLYFDDVNVRPLKTLHEKHIIEILIDEACMEELLTVLEYDHFLGSEVNKTIIEKKIRSLCNFVETKTAEAPSFWCRDPDDIKFLDLSSQHNVGHLITKDLHLLKRKNRRSLGNKKMTFSIMSPSNFFNTFNHIE